ncbi:MAG: hypothetical protein EU529_05860 [Promethearchaeota archaeon]|nr:MAG: hypothetical protein EU529_05860 [Candidatus Lokiarchaeota archaeon]
MEKIMGIIMTIIMGIIGQKYLCKETDKVCPRCGEGRVWLKKEGNNIIYYCNNIECGYKVKLNSIEKFLKR